MFLFMLFLATLVDLDVVSLILLPILLLNIFLSKEIFDSFLYKIWPANRYS